MKICECSRLFSCETWEFHTSKWLGEVIYGTTTTTITTITITITTRMIIIIIIITSCGVVFSTEVCVVPRWVLDAWWVCRWCYQKLWWWDKSPSSQQAGGTVDSSDVEVGEISWEISAKFRWNLGWWRQRHDSLKKILSWLSKNLAKGNILTSVDVDRGHFNVPCMTYMGHLMKTKDRGVQMIWNGRFRVARFIDMNALWASNWCVDSFLWSPQL